MNKEYGNVDKKTITEPIKDRNNANKYSFTKNKVHHNYIISDLLKEMLSKKLSTTKTFYKKINM